MNPEQASLFMPQAPSTFPKCDVAMQWMKSIISLSALISDPNTDAEVREYLREILKVFAQSVVEEMSPVYVITSEGAKKMVLN